MTAPAPAPVNADTAPRRRPPSLRVLVIGTVLVPVVLVVVILSTLSRLTGRGVAERLGESLLDAAVAHVRADTTRFLDTAVRTSDLYARRIADGGLPLRGLGAWERSELDDLVTNPEVASICFGAADGETTWLLRREGRLELGRVVGPTGRASEFGIDAAGAVSPTPLREYDYDPRARPWYASALARPEPHWTPIYFWFGDHGTDRETGVGYTRAIRAADGSVAGVLVIDATLGEISSFLRSLPLAGPGGLFVIDDQGLIVAASRGSVTTTTGERTLFAESNDPGARAAAAAIASTEAGPVTRCTVAGEAAWVRVTPFNPHRGIAWRIVAVVPESVFLGEAHDMQRRAMWVGGIAVAGSVLVALGLARRMALPLLALAAHVRRVGSGDFAARIDLRNARELSELSGELNRMSGGLQERAELQQALSLAMEVQQSLLPKRAPVVKGMDIAGSSRYCDATGGDYYDFIDVAGLPGGGVLIAVADVMGHGIAAALLMASARAALRAQATAGASMGALMTSLNTVLAKDMTHGRFITMVLLAIDPAAARMRWACAGHQPPIIFDPAAGRFVEIDGGDLPLGITEGVTYEEYVVERLPPNAEIVIGTDGIWEAANAANEQFGYERLRRVMREQSGRPSKDVLAAIDRALREFCGPLPAKDDITAVVVRLTGTAATEVASRR